jgi:hypothetical protein
MLNIMKPDKQIISIMKSICKVPKSIPNLAMQLLYKIFTMNVFSFKNAYPLKELNALENN